MSGFGKVLGGSQPLPPVAQNPEASPVVPLPPDGVVEPWWYIRAKAELGQKEIPGHNDNARIVYYHSFTTLKASDDETPWCASFMCYVLKGGTRSAQAKSYLNYGTPLKGFKKYAIAVFTRDGGGHVGLALDEKDGKILLLGGNQGNAVSIAWRDKSGLLGYRWPPA